MSDDAETISRDTRFVSGVPPAKSRLLLFFSPPG
jgi:hypothetical protein